LAALSERSLQAITTREQLRAGGPGPFLLREILDPQVLAGDRLLVPRESIQVMNESMLRPARAIAVVRLDEREQRIDGVA
jgi:hypothetical protein